MNERQYLYFCTWGNKWYCTIIHVFVFILLIPIFNFFLHLKFPFFFFCARNIHFEKEQCNVLIEFRCEVSAFGNYDRDQLNWLFSFLLICNLIRLRWAYYIFHISFQLMLGWCWFIRMFPNVNQTDRWMKTIKHN